MSERIHDILRELKNGFSDTDCKHAVREFLNLWADKLGFLTTECEREPQSRRFESR